MEMVHTPRRSILLAMRNWTPLVEGVVPFMRTLHLCGDTWTIEHGDEPCTHDNCHTVQLAERVPA